jgi:Protein of unknown function (DUF4232)
MISRIRPALRTFRLVAVLLALAAGSGCESSWTRVSPGSRGKVPWVSRPLPPYVVPVAGLIRYPTTAPPCRAGKLRVSQGRSGVGLGNRLEELVFENVGATPCLLRGYPTISAETPSGRRRVLRPQRGDTYFGRLVPADLPVGGHVFIDFATSTGCEGGRKPAVHYRRPVFALPRGGNVQAKRVSISETCGLSMSEFGLPERYASPRAGPGTAGTLQVRLRLPAGVRAATVLRFDVVLIDPTATTVVLRPCPGYSEGLYAAGLAAERSYALNCDSVHIIPAHGRVRYAMRLAVPRQIKSGIAKLGWNLNTPAGPFASNVVRIAAG